MKNRKWKWHGKLYLPGIYELLTSDPFVLLIRVSTSQWEGRKGSDTSSAKDRRMGGGRREGRGADFPWCLVEFLALPSLLVGAFSVLRLNRIPLKTKVSVCQIFFRFVLYSLYGVRVTNDRIFSFLISSRSVFPEVPLSLKSGGNRNKYVVK